MNDYANKNNTPQPPNYGDIFYDLSDWSPINPRDVKVIRDENGYVTGYLVRTPRSPIDGTETRSL